MSDGVYERPAAGELERTIAELRKSLREAQSALAAVTAERDRLKMLRLAGMTTLLDAGESER